MMTVLPLSQGSLDPLLPLAWQQYALTNEAGRYKLALSGPGYTHQEILVKVTK